MTKCADFCFSMGYSKVCRSHDAFILATNSKKTRAIEHLDIVAVANDAEMENNLSFSITSRSSSDVDDNEGASMVPAMFPHAKTKI